MQFSFSASETDSKPTVSSDSTSTKANNLFGDNFVDKKQTDNILHRNVEENQDNSSLSFKPLQDSREYIGKSLCIYI